MRVLGIDPGSRFLGYGVVEDARGRLCHVGHGVIRTDGSAPLEARLVEIFDELSQVVALFRPEAVAVEGVFTFRNARSALVLGHARGVALLVAARATLPVHEYAPARVKRSVGAGGAAGKDAVGRMVKTLLGLTSTGRHDAADALAVAVCHLNHGRFGAPPKPRASARRAASLEALAGRLSPSYQRFGAAR
ncbi:MAG: crossover junction endodeoxyribonuclease RuvC [Myxococcaceae bacterium]